jgi:hypothetical protein
VGPRQLNSTPHETPSGSSAILSDPQRSSAILSDPQRSSAILKNITNHTPPPIIQTHKQASRPTISPHLVNSA